MVRTEIVTDIDLQPRWLRVGPACKYGGFSRTKLYQHLAQGQIKSVCVTSAVKRRGTRVITMCSESAGNTNRKQMITSCREARMVFISVVISISVINRPSARLD